METEISEFIHSFRIYLPDLMLEFKDTKVHKTLLLPSGDPCVEQRTERTK